MFLLAAGVAMFRELTASIGSLSIWLLREQCGWAGPIFSFILVLGFAVLWQQTRPPLRWPILLLRQDQRLALPIRSISRMLSAKHSKPLFSSLDRRSSITAILCW